MLKRPKSDQVFKELCQVIPGGVNSPVRAFKGLGLLPMVVDRGEKDRLYDMDGHSYIDFCLSWGPLIHGHAHPEIVKCVHERVLKGTTFGITTQVEEKLARKITQHIPSIEKIRFVSSGTEATMSAARLARGFTKRPLIIKFSGNFHGHADFFLVQAGSGLFGLNPSSTSQGVPDDIVRHTVCLPYNDVEATRSFMQDPKNKGLIAAVIVEPIAGNMGVVPATQEFLDMLREETLKIGALLIFDEVITGYRVGLGGAQKKYHIKPDITCLAKIIGGGFPAAGFGGRADIMECLAPLGQVYQAGTLSGNPVAMVAGLKTIEMLEQPDVYKQLEAMANIITQPVKEKIAQKNLNACVQQEGSMFTLFFGRRTVQNMEDAKELDLELFAKYFRYMFENGVYLPPMQHEAWFVSTVHENENLVKTRDLTLKFLNTVS